MRHSEAEITVTPKKYLKFSDGSKEMINNITSRLKQGKAIRRSLKEWGRLHIDRLLPFLVKKLTHY